MYLVLNAKKQPLWFIDREFSELSLTRSNPGPIFLDPSFYDEEVLEKITQSAEKDEIGFFETEDEADAYLSVHSFIDEGVKLFSRKARVILSNNKTLEGIKKAVLKLKSFEKTHLCKPLHEKPRWTTIYETMISLEENSGHPRQDVIEWLRFCIQQFNQSLENHLEEIKAPEDMGITIGS